MRVFRYQPEACGVPDGGIRCVSSHTEATDDPALADVFLIPCNYYQMGDTPPIRSATLRQSFQYLKAYPERHVLVDLIEHIPPPDLPGLVYCRAALTPAMLREYPTAVAMPWWVGNGHFGADLGERLDAAADDFGFSHDVSFVGWRTPNGRQRMICDEAIASVQEAFGERAFVHAFGDFHGHRIADDETLRREQLYTGAVRAAVFQLAPASAPGVLRYRVFEALRAGRIPVIVDDDVVLPRADTVEWGRVAVHVATDRARDTGAILRELLASWDVAEIQARCREARTAWLRCFDGRRADALLAELAYEHVVRPHGRR